MLTEYALIANRAGVEVPRTAGGEIVEVLPLRSWGPRWVVANVIDVVDGLDRKERRDEDDRDWDRSPPRLHRLARRGTADLQARRHRQLADLS